MAEVPALRIQKANEKAAAAHGEYVLYWMVAQRRLTHNFALDRAVEWCEKLQKPLVILEALRVDYPWASDRLHAFVIAGMLEKQQQKTLPCAYYPYVEPRVGAGKGLLAALAKQACVVITDEFPCFFLPTMVAAAAKKIDVLMETVDGNGLLPLRAASQKFDTAYAFRRFLQKNLPAHLENGPRPNAFKKFSLSKANIPTEILQKWPPLEATVTVGDLVAQLPIHHGVGRVDELGGEAAAQNRLQHFLKEGLPRYGTERSHPDAQAASGFSPYLHFGFLSVHDVFLQVAKKEKWSLESIGDKAQGKRQGWWGMSPSAESFLDELVTWREVGYQFAHQVSNYDAFDSLPAWAKKTLAEHAKDKREFLYTLQQFESAATHDAVWNAAQTELVKTGKMQNYLRMLWGKKILEWTKTPEMALEVMIELNNKYALDGRNPNSYSGIFWVLGRFDRPWGPVRPVFGTIRFMSSKMTLQKLRMKKYLDTFGKGASCNQSTLF